MHRYRVTALVTVAVACVVATIPSAAMAAPGDTGGSDSHVTKVSKAELVAASANSKDAASRAEAKSAYLDQQARSGRLVDGQHIKSAVVKGATVVWDDGVNVDGLTFAPMSGADGNVDGQELILESSPNVSAATGGSTSTTGLGLDVTSGLRGGTRVSGSCVTTTVNGDDATTCFAKYKATYVSTSYNYYYYERWATGVARPATTWAIAYTPAIIDIRSRPWAGSSAATHTKQLNDYWPRGGSVGCTQSGSVGYSAAGVSMTVPLQDCNTTTPIPDATSKTMGVIYDQGSFGSGQSKSAEFGMTVALDKGYVANMADYTYMKFCRPYLCQNQSGNLRKDAGW